MACCSWSSSEAISTRPKLLWRETTRMIPGVRGSTSRETRLRAGKDRVSEQSLLRPNVHASPGASIADLDSPSRTVYSRQVICSLRLTSSFSTLTSPVASCPLRVAGAWAQSIPRGLETQAASADVADCAGGAEVGALSGHHRVVPGYSGAPGDSVRKDQYAPAKPCFWH